MSKREENPPKISKVVSRVDYTDGSRYEGDWIDGKRNGNGAFYNQDGIKLYDGEWRNNEMEGLGTGFYPNGAKKYEGQWVNGKKNGYGVFITRMDQYIEVNGLMIKDMEKAQIIIQITAKNMRAIGMTIE
jgi:hypothetical protein